jgi:hypothetical protein
MTKLPQPQQWILKRMNEMECAEMIERHIDFVDENGRSVHLPMPFVRHYLQRDDGALPTVVAISTLPIVLADGGLLAPDGLDRLRGIVFIIPKELRAILPKDVTSADVGKAMTYLTDVWLCDVETTYEGKCTIIAAALTVMERSLLPTRPAFFVTAGRRGSGKTTTLTMLIMALTGLWPAAAAWSTNEEERRKALLSYFLCGVPYILWDNIARGTQISCPHIEKSCTSAYYADRKLGVSEMVSTAAASIHFFTGNNIGPLGDLASRSLTVRLEVDRADPENREFKHPDPVGWTENNRAEILKSLYTILLGNPTLKKPRDAQMKTRYKMWWRIVGSAVENAAKARDKEVDFQKLFAQQDEADEDDVSLAEFLAAVKVKWPETFKATDVSKAINGGFGDATCDTLRDFLYPTMSVHQSATPKSVGKRLSKHIGEMVRGNGETLVLKAGTEKKETIYWVEVKPDQPGTA